MPVGIAVAADCVIVVIGAAGVAGAIPAMLTAPLPAPAARSAAVVMTADSSRVPHDPHSGQRPNHLGVVYPHSEHTHSVRCFFVPFAAAIYVEPPSAQCDYLLGSQVSPGNRSSLCLGRTGTGEGELHRLRGAFDEVGTVHRGGNVGDAVSLGSCGRLSGELLGRAGDEGAASLDGGIPVELYRPTGNGDRFEGDRVRVLLLIDSGKRQSSLTIVLLEHDNVAHTHILILGTSVGTVNCGLGLGSL